MAPYQWDERQYKSDTSAERMKRHRQHKRDVTGDVTVTPQNRTDQNRTEAVTVEVTDEQALAAWDAYGKATTGRPYPRNRRGSWHFPTKWPPGHGAEIHTIATGRKA